MTIMQFNITKFDNHDCMIFKNNDHSLMIIVTKMVWNIIYNSHYDINNYSRGCDYMI